MTREEVVERVLELMETIKKLREIYKNKKISGMSSSSYRLLKSVIHAYLEILR